MGKGLKDSYSAWLNVCPVFHFQVLERHLCHTIDIGGLRLRQAGSPSTSMKMTGSIYD
jgi:hypothetical protein